MKQGIVFIEADVRDYWSSDTNICYRTSYFDCNAEVTEDEHCYYVHSFDRVYNFEKVHTIMLLKDLTDKEECILKISKEFRSNHIPAGYYPEKDIISSIGYTINFTGSRTETEFELYCYDHANLMGWNFKMDIE